MDWIAIVGSIFVLAGGAMLIAAGRQLTRRRGFIRHSAIASGTIVAVIENRESDGVSYFPKVKFRTLSDLDVTFESEMGTSLDTRRIGDTVTVRYRTDQPHTAEIDSFMSLWGLTLLLGVLGAVFLIVGAGILGRLIPV